MRHFGERGGVSPLVNSPPDREADAAPLADLIDWPCEVDTAKMTPACRTLVPALVGGREEPRTPGESAMRWEQKVQYASLSDVGFRRRNNQDSFAVMLSPDAETFQHQDRC